MIRNIIFISDTHAGCQFGLCPPGKIPLDGGGYYVASALQLKVWEMWREFWDEWVPMVTRGEEYVVVMNGDATDGRHHGSTTQISQNLSDQQKIAQLILAPIVEKCKGKYYHIRGTEAHVGPTGENEERLAEIIGAVPNEIGNYARWELWSEMDNGILCHFSHHIGTTSSSGYESTAVYKEMVEAFNEAGRWNNKPPNIVARSHRHRQFETKIVGDNGYYIALVSPGWQLKTPFVHRLASGRASTPQIGGVLIRINEEEGVFTRYYVRKIARSKVVKL
jgi:hypothetical protein